MKNKLMQAGLLAAVVALFANSALAGGGPPPTVPDAGSTAILVAISLSGLSLCRKLIR